MALLGQIRRARQSKDTLHNVGGTLAAGVVDDFRSA